MKIAVIIPPFLTLPVQGQGGTERIAQGMIDELIRRGHQVTLFGAGQSQTPAEFVQVLPRAIAELKTDPGTTEASRPLRLEASYLTAVMQLIVQRDGDFDVIINHARGGYLFLPIARFLKTPILTVFHLPLFPELVTTLQQFPQPNLVSISDRQRQSAGDQVSFLATVYNGLDLAEFPFEPNPDDYLLYMGAMGEHKSPHLAIEAAKQAGTRLILAGGKVRQPYFNEQVQPHIDDQQVRYVGEVTATDRVKLLQKAHGLLMPITWEEPFGLVMIEAMACGTPVIGFDHGAVSEVVTEGETGFIVPDVAGMAQAIGQLRTLDRAACRRRVEQYFTYEKMVDGYIKAIEALGGAE